MLLCVEPEARGAGGVSAARSLMFSAPASWAASPRRRAAIASRRASLPSGPSSSRPSGRPPAVIAAGRLMPGMPATLPGLVLRMKVGKVGTRSPFSTTVSSSPIGAAAQRRRREDDGGDVVALEVLAVGRLQLRPQDVERVAVGRLGDRAFAVQALQQAGDVGARALARPAPRSPASSRGPRGRRRGRRPSRRARSESRPRRRARPTSAMSPSTSTAPASFSDASAPSIRRADSRCRAASQKCARGTPRRRPFRLTGARRRCCR